MSSLLNLRARLLLMSGFLVAVIVGLGGSMLAARWQTASDMSHLASLGEVAPELGNLVHELQTERGLSAGLIGSADGGANSGAFRYRLILQRRATDEAGSTLIRELEALDPVSFGEGLVDDVRAIRAALDGLPAKRQAVSSGELALGDMAAYYSDTIARLLGLVEQMGRVGRRHAVSRTITAYAALLQAKERAGLERAMGTTGFGSGAFSPEIYRRFIDLQGQQRAFVVVFKANASADQVAFYERTFRGAAVEEIERMRAVAADSVFDGDLQGIAGPHWFDAMAKKVELYRTLEKRLAHDLLATAEAIREDALVMEDIALIVLLALGVVFGGVQAHRLSKALEREKELNGLQRQFISLVSHEFRTPLAIIDMNAQRVVRSGDKVTPDRLVRAMHKIRNAIMRLTDLMDGVLSAARLDEGSIEFEPTACNLAEVITELCDDYQQINADHRLMVDLDDMPAQIEGDTRLLRQAFSNLISNAIKYSPEGTSIQVTASQADDYFVITVRDQGVGIPQEELGRLFERFFRASTSIGVAGTGIGLHLVKHVVGLHGGTIEVESEPGKGTAFSVRLPRKPPKTQRVERSGQSEELRPAYQD